MRENSIDGAELVYSIGFSLERITLPPCEVGASTSCAEGFIATTMVPSSLQVLCIWDVDGMDGNVDANIETSISRTRHLQPMQLTQLTQVFAVLLSFAALYQSDRQDSVSQGAPGCIVSIPLTICTHRPAKAFLPYECEH